MENGTTKVGIKAKVVIIAEVEAGVAAVPVPHRTPTKTFTRKRPRKDSRAAPTNIYQKHIFAVTSDKDGPFFLSGAQHEEEFVCGTLHCANSYC